jgi:hypothetical protein
VAAHIVCRNLIRDPLKAEIVHQPVEQSGAVMPFDCATQILVAKLVEQVERASKTADLVDQANGMINRSGIEIDWFCF